ncbi:heme lyase CcmF/NrfE family subunit [Uliginosibacterium gangwonense]|uniref:heme lyase CcmF/NrfE family subunit n=1 Tax=Uliginosibacterium gangwonense TaxID=392736 RepID=UPI00035DDF00|nr:heme lyase CcmF/NrfE family subunit [Uliginosibacterium gangwonense]
MIPELGHFALVLALCISLAQAVLPLLGAWHNNTTMMNVARPAAFAQFLFVGLAFLVLTIAFILKDFSVLYVASHTSTQTPLAYRITAVWGSHEGSLLLWGLILSLWTAAVAQFSRALPEVFVARVLGVMGCVSTGFFAFLLIASNPFQRLFPAALEGGDLNPLLQDPGMIIHPPLLYMGYVGFSVAFAFAIAALLSGQLDAAWARWTRPWTAAAWIFLTLGIAIGSRWAYYELGWGGWWFWDPVENASFMPWLVGTALLHSLAVTEKRGAFRSWTVLMAIGAFSLSLLGTFIVRSGVLTSVHAFAADPRRGLFILALLILVIGTSLVLFAWRAPSLSSGGRFQNVSRETALLLNNVLLLSAAASVLLGTLYPLLVDALGIGKISVGPPYFEAVFLPLMAPVIFFMVIGPLLHWKGHKLSTLLPNLRALLLITVVLAAALAWMAGVPGWKMTVGLGLAAWVIVVSVQQLRQRVKDTQRGKWFDRLLGIPRGWWGMWLAHMGIAVFILGVTLVRGLESNIDVQMRISDTAHLAGYDFTMTNIEDYAGPNFDSTRATIKITRHASEIATLQPEKRVYRTTGTPMTEAAIHTNGIMDLYVSMGDELDNSAWILRIYSKPFVCWIWFGCLLMAAGGAIAASDRRYRMARRKTPKDASAQLAADTAS